MASIRKGLPQLRSTLKLPQRSRDASSKDLVELLTASFWPMVAAAFEDVEDHVEARFLQLGDLQVVISRAPARGRPVRPDAQRRVTLEVWPPAGPRLLEVEWSGRRPYVVHRREGDWLQRLIRASRQFE